MKFYIVSLLVTSFMRFWNIFLRTMEIYIPDPTAKIFQNKSGFILAAWHGQTIPLTHHCCIYLDNKLGNHLCPVVSLSKDGEFIHQTFLRYNVHSVRGSTSRGGANALRGVLKAIKEGKNPVFTPDGPRGPIYKVQPGVILMASMGKIPIISAYASFDRYYQFKSWDRHRFPKFAARQWIEYSEPFYVPEGIKEEKDIQEYMLKLENWMMEQNKRQERKADQYRKIKEITE